MQALYSSKNQTLTVLFSGDYIAYDNGHEKSLLFAALKKQDPQRIAFDCKELGAWDSSLLLVLFELTKYANQKNIKVDQAGLPAGLRQLLELAFSVDRKPPQERVRHLGFLSALGNKALICWSAVQKGLSFMGQAKQSFSRLLQKKAIMQPVDFFFALDDCGPKAIGIVSLISFMVGLILAFVGALQLKTFGAQVYVASLVTIAMIRIMGAIMAAIIMAGRTGASYAATIGTMQVNEEIDALKTMGISPIDFLVLPRLMALIIAMPLLTILADFMGMLGGGFVGVLLLGIPVQEYWRFSIEAFGLTNFLVGVFHGLIFGVVIALCGCYYGIHCGRNADSVGKATTKAVVSAIVWMIVMTGIITAIFEVIGI